MIKCKDPNTIDAEKISHYTSNELGNWIALPGLLDVYPPGAPGTWLSNSEYHQWLCHTLKDSVHAIKTSNNSRWDVLNGWTYVGAHSELKEPSTTNPTEGIKFDSDKPKMDLLSSYAIEELSKVLTFGAQKYDSHNWRKGIKLSRLLAACLRHVFKFLSGEDTDPETNLSHIAHAMCCCMFILELYHTSKTKVDDRYKLETSDENG